MTFVWDKTKAKTNDAKHGIRFEQAKEIFKDPFAVEFLDERQDYGEERYVTIGMADGMVLYVAYTERMDIIRIISARRATKYEQEIYFEQST